MNLDDRKLAPNLVFVFAVATLALAIAVTKLVPGSYTPKMWAGIYFALYGAGAAAAAFFTRTGALRAIGAFSLAGAGLGIFYYITVSRHMASAGSFGTGMAIMLMVMFLASSLAAGIAGTLFGLKLRKGLARAGVAAR